ncbi:uncharacterized protein LOC106096129 isoform X1 [Stomoxys calcitrans]|uniref:uncharacterized protein LOC106096129 isoform X1 n=1 Tax=Stomoxys calcitrans TaxID=35570 RepID=UPI0027E21B9D|nr:uncharacterized protein LOC106096129 isoform X1 [Stomoxys calcitrans]XP_059226236.1 uncharacterized protein LOC106096129 isoform X1 [Stomoxys calcitrans]
MFGSKLRSWMENHIVRSRKKGNKNKNATSLEQTTTTTTTLVSDQQHKHKHAASGFTIYHHHQGNSNGSSNGCSSPYKRNSDSQTSSSANHTGCSSVLSSPVRRREVSPIQNHTQSRYGWQSPDRENVMSPKSDNFLYAPQHHSQQYLRSHHTAPNTRENSCEERQYQHQQGHQQTQQQQQSQQHQLNCSTSSFSSLSWSTGSKEPSMHSNNNQNPSSINASALTDMTNGNVERRASYSPPDEVKNFEDDPNVVHYEEIGTLIRHPEKLLQDILNDIERPKSEQFPQVAQRIPAFSDEKQTQDDASTRYGRLLPSKIPNPTVISFRTGSEECIPRHGSNFTVQNVQTRNGNRTKMRNGPQASLGAPMVSLSSPESAYSTGYSTDGTSPGAGYTPPEYYVNMRTGTHYFPKSVNSLAIEAQRYKFGLNKIEEMSPIDPLPKTSFAHRNLEENESGLVKHHPSSMDSYEKSLGTQYQLQNGPNMGSHSPLPIRNTIVIPTLKGFESPSPRQRSRIRTNPWYSTTETSSSSSTMNNAGAHLHESSSALMNTSQISCMTMSSTSSHSTSALSTIHLEQDFQRISLPTAIVKSSRNYASGSSGGASWSMQATTSGSSINISSSTGTGNNNCNHNNNNNKSSSSMACVSSGSSSSLTEVENAQRPYTPNTVRRKRSLQLQQQQHHYTHTQHPVEPVASASASPQKKQLEAPLAVVSDDDTTLNEMMGKFDESYIYEKETDILSSDSDPTDCPTDLDTGQDAGDECDTDDLLDIDFIDTSSMQEIHDRRDQVNLGKCYYINGSPVMPQRKASSFRSRRSTRSSKASGEQTLLNAAAGNAQRRRKRFHKTRKKSSEGKENCRSPMRKPRETRSVGGTPVCLRKNTRSHDRQRYSHTTPHQLSHRSSSLVFTHVRENRFMTIAESEKALLKADFEADVKYKQLIMEAESILASMRNSVQSIPRETPVASPRRVNPLANKRVEMIKNCEIDLQKQQQQAQSKSRSSDLSDQELTAAVNKRIEMLKLETQSPPGSPKLGACSPRKTHLTNFINQNISPEPGLRKNLNSPLVQRRSLSPSASPMQQRRLTTPQINMKLQTFNQPNTNQLSDSDQDYHNGAIQQASLKANDHLNQNYLQMHHRPTREDQSDVQNHNTVQPPPKMGPKITFNYCPQSEPLKRKVYKSHATFDNNRLRKNGIHREEQLKHQRSKTYNTGSGDVGVQRQGKLKTSCHELNQFSSMNGLKTDFSSATNMMAYSNFNSNSTSSIATNATDKAALIQRTIADLKRDLEHQSFELNGLHET